MNLIILQGTRPPPISECFSIFLFFLCTSFFVLFYHPNPLLNPILFNEGLFTTLKFKSGLLYIPTNNNVMRRRLYEHEMLKKNTKTKK